MMMKITPILAIHWHFGPHGDRGILLLLMAMAACALILAWPGKSETKK
jgi:hypothetical protein